MGKLGWEWPRCDLLHFCKKQFIIDNCLEPTPYWNDWNDPRDGMRHCPDKSKFRSKWMCCADYYEVDKYNKKLKKMEYRRRQKLMRQKAILTGNVWLYLELDSQV
jgi:hypothetical protein